MTSFVAHCIMGSSSYGLFYCFILGHAFELVFNALAIFCCIQACNLSLFEVFYLLLNQANFMLSLH